MSNKFNEDDGLKIINNTIEKMNEINNKTFKYKKNEEKQDILNILNVLNEFIKNKKLICYGGTAINNILPKKHQFYNYNLDIPDYDIYSTNALEDSKEIADIFSKKGFSNVEVRTSIHTGTYKVSVLFIPIMDITNIDISTFNNMKKDSVVIDDIIYAPINYLRMSMYKELSRPNGQISRWEKVFKRLNLLNKSFPMKNKNCYKMKFDDFKDYSEEKIIEEENIFENVKNVFINNKSVFIGEFACSLYGKYMSKEKNNFINKRKRFHIEILSVDPSSDIKLIFEKLKKYKYNITFKSHNEIGSIIKKHYEIYINDIPICLIYYSDSCYNYNTIKHENKDIKVATIDTIMTFLLAEYYTGRSYYDNDKILCIAQYLFIIQNKYKIAKKGLLKRFNLDCIGYEETIQDKRIKKSLKYNILKNKKDSKEYKKHFFRYNPTEKDDIKKIIIKQKKNKTKSLKILKNIKNKTLKKSKK